MDRKVTIRVKNQCGVNRGYPMNDTAKLFAELIKPRKTFNSEDVAVMEKLGFELDIEMVKMEEVIVK